MPQIARREASPRREIARPFGAQGWEPFRIFQDLLGWNPFNELDRMIGRPAEEVFSPDFDLREGPDAYTFKADLPGVREEDLEVNVTGNRMTISGRREEEPVAEGESYYLCERAAGTFSRSFSLPEGCDPDHVKAELKDGVLTVKLPKRPEVKPRKVQITAGGAAAGKRTQG
jgi:HSP20 family protein